MGVIFKFTPRLFQASLISKWNDLSRNNAFLKNLIILDWEKNGRPSPPPHIIKQLAIVKFQQKSKYTCLIETGTFLGDMIEAQKDRFEQLYSIELSKSLYLKAQNRFKHLKRIKILNGDSGAVLVSLMNEVKKPSIFWLDGHYSGGFTAKGEKDCPILEELDAIFSGSNFQHIILIDDARLFVGKNAYPTIQELRNYLSLKALNYKLEIEDDIIALYPTSM